MALFAMREGWISIGNVYAQQWNSWMKRYLMQLSLVGLFEITCAALLVIFLLFLRDISRGFGQHFKYNSYGQVC